jgi:hypothetical protein
MLDFLFPAAAPPKLATLTPGERKVQWLANPCRVWNGSVNEPPARAGSFFDALPFARRQAETLFERPVFGVEWSLSNAQKLTAMAERQDKTAPGRSGFHPNRSSDRLAGIRPHVDPHPATIFISSSISGTPSASRAPATNGSQLKISSRLFPLTCEYASTYADATSGATGRSST